MNFEEARLVVENAILAKANRHLNDAEVTIFRGSWEGQTYDEMAEKSGYQANYLKGDAGHKFWKLLSEVLEEPVGKRNFRAAVERARSRFGVEDTIQMQWVDGPEQVKGTIADRTPDEKAIATPRQDWDGAPDVPVFYGREEELAKLQEWVVKDRCRLVVLWGMFGIGKTLLSVKLAEEIKGKFDYVIWRSLRNAPPLNELLADLILFLSHQQETDLQENRHDSISRLMQDLRDRRCLLVLDSWEAISQSGESVENYKKGYEGYGEFLRQVGEGRHNSCLVLTSREKAAEMPLLEGSFVRSFQLESLKEAAARKILEEKDLLDQEYWGKLIDGYAGNPLLLKIVAVTIKEVFGGSVSRFIDQGTEVGVVVPEVVNPMLYHQFKNLSELENKIMCCLAINLEHNHRPVSLLQLKLDLKEKNSSKNLTNSLESLIGRSLIEKTSTKAGETGFTLQPVVMKYVIRDRKDVCDRLDLG